MSCGNVFHFLLKVGAHYFEEGNVQLDAKHECKDTTIIQVERIVCGLKVHFLYFLVSFQSGLSTRIFLLDFCCVE